MDLPREIDGCVAYVVARTKGSPDGQILGTCLMLVRPTKIAGFNIFYALTAAHVVQEAQSKRYEAELRLNAAEIGAVVRPAFSKWFFPEDKDVGSSGSVLNGGI
jgi:hypothetical protein